MSERKTAITFTATEVAVLASALVFWENDLAQNDELPITEKQLEKLSAKVYAARDRVGRVPLFVAND